MSVRTKVALRGAEMRSISEDFRPIAIESIDRIIKIAKTIHAGCSRGDKEASQFCGTLSSVLWSIKSYLQKPRQAQDEREKKIEGLLNNLERICSVSIRIILIY